MAHSKIVHIHRSYLAAEPHLELALPFLHPEVKARLLAVARGLTSPGTLPPDARILAHSAGENGGNVSLVLESKSFPWTPDGTPFSDLHNLAPELEAPLSASAPKSAVSPASAASSPKPSKKAATQPAPEEATD